MFKCNILKWLDICIFVSKFSKFVYYKIRFLIKIQSWNCFAYFSDCLSSFLNDIRDAKSANVEGVYTKNAWIKDISTVVDNTWIKSFFIRVVYARSVSVTSAYIEVVSFRSYNIGDTYIRNVYTRNISITSAYIGVAGFKGYYIGILIPEVFLL